MQRIHYMDNLRALAMLLGVFFHAGLAYSPLMNNYFPTVDRQQSVIVDVVLWFFHLFRMPLFFVVAGFFAAYLIQKRGLRGFFQLRLRRIALPFVIFWPLSFAALYYSTLYAAEHVQHPSPVLVLIKQFSTMETPPQAPPTTGHLWFLYYLMIFYVLIWSIGQLPVHKLAQRVRQMSPRSQLGLLPLLLTPALASTTAPHAAPDSFLPQFWAFGFFGVYFAFGLLLHQHESIITQFKPMAPWLFIGSALLYTLFLIVLEQQSVTAPSVILSWALATIEAYISAWMVAFCLIAGKQWLDRSDVFLRYIADASYWIYVAHLPVLFVIQYWLMDQDIVWPLKFFYAVTSTLIVCFLSYHVLVRSTWIGVLLNGSRKTPLKEARISSST